MSNDVTDRCRLVLVAPPGVAGAEFAARLASALAGGDVASVIFPVHGMDEAAFQEHLEACVPVVQAAGVAAIVVNDTRAFGRTGADGLHIDTGARDLGEAVERLQGRHIIGAGGAKARHDALDLGEKRPDYVFFGRFGFDTRPGPHKKFVELAEWWAGMIEIPCVVQGGSSLDTLGETAATGAEFVALSHAVFGGEGDPGAVVAAANGILEGYSLNEVA